jgi:hypothetical protein
MAAAPVISATSLASSLGIAVKNASPLLEALVRARDCDRGDASL